MNATEIIQEQQEVFTMPRIGDKAPDFTATTTQRHNS
jgi:peroxiredoxin (alkyl hydroperoxide reductase subunit C)